MLVEFGEQHFHRPLELRIVAFADGVWVEIDFDIGCDAVIFDFPLAVRGPESAAGRRNHTPVHQVLLRAEEADQSAPRALPDQRADVELAEVERHGIAARAGVFVNDHGFRPGNQAHRPGGVLAIARGAVIEEAALKVGEDVIGHGAAPVEALVHHRAFPARLREEIAIEESVAAGRGIGKINVGEAAVAESVDRAAVFFHPGEVAQSLLRRDGDDLHFARSGAAGVGTDAQADGAVGSAFEEAVDLIGSANLLPVHGQQIFAGNDIDAGLGERRAQLRVPILAVVDAGEAVAAILDGVVGAEESAGHVGNFGEVAATDAQMADGEAAERFLEKIIQIDARAYAFEVRLIELLGGREVEPMEAGVVEEIAFQTEGFVVHLLPFGQWVDSDFHGV